MLPSASGLLCSFSFAYEIKAATVLNADSRYLCKAYFFECFNESIYSSTMPYNSSVREGNTHPFSWIFNVFCWFMRLKFNLTTAYIDWSTDMSRARSKLLGIHDLTDFRFARKCYTNWDARMILHYKNEVTLYLVQQWLYIFRHGREYFFLDNLLFKDIRCLKQFLINREIHVSQ